MKLKGTIIIVDPSYFLNEQDMDAFTKNNVETLTKLGFTNYSLAITGITDSEINKLPWQTIAEAKLNLPIWTSAVFDNNHDSLGYFSSKSGHYGVFLLDEINSYCPDFGDLIVTEDLAVSIILDFDGEIEHVLDSDGKSYLNSDNKFYTIIN